MRKAASGVRFPERACSMYKLPPSTVNSKSCMSPNSCSSEARAASSSRYASGGAVFEIGDSERIAPAGHDVFALSVGQIIDV